MPEYDPRAELAPRDVVSRAIVSQMEKTRHPNVYLDMSHLGSADGAHAVSGEWRRFAPSLGWTLRAIPFRCGRERIT